MASNSRSENLRCATRLCGWVARICRSSIRRSASIARLGRVLRSIRWMNASSRCVRSGRSMPAAAKMSITSPAATAPAASWRSASSTSGGFGSPRPARSSASNLAIQIRTESKNSMSSRYFWTSGCAVRAPPAETAKWSYERSVSPIAVVNLGVRHPPRHLPLSRGHPLAMLVRAGEPEPHNGPRRLRTLTRRRRYSSPIASTCPSAALPTLPEPPLSPLPAFATWIASTGPHPHER